MFKAEITDNRIIVQPGQEQAVANAIVIALTTALGIDLEEVEMNLTFSRTQEVTETHIGRTQ